MRDIISLVGEVVPCLKEKTFFLAAVSVNFINIETIMIKKTKI